LEASHGYLSFDGCFWHGCPVHATQPKTNTAFWRK
jgi:DNA mismatch endonuclease (patch repair protein)